LNILGINPNIFFGIKLYVSEIENSINFIILSEILPKFMLHFTKKLYISFGLLLFIGLFYACNKQIPENQISSKTSFEIIQDNILTPSCALSGCHLSNADATFSQHGLVLSKGNSFANLVGKSPINAAAKADKLLLVFPGDATYSFLYHKIACDSLHNHGNAALYGSHMPMGGGYISKGQVEFIRRWINAGASLTDRTVDQSILKDSSACQIAFTPLAAPLPSLGFQLKTDLFSVQPNFEREIFERRITPNTDTVYINKIEMRGRPNSHHFVIYSYRNALNLPSSNVIRDLRNPDGSINLQTFSDMQNQVFFAGGTDVNSTIELAPGTALKLNPNSGLDLNAHYFNTSKLVLAGENYANFYTVPASQVKNVVKILDWSNLDVSIPAGQRKTFTKNFTFNAVTRLSMLTSHYHKLGESFIIRIYGGARNGEIIYSSTDWQHPIVKTYTTPIVFQPGEGLTSEVTYYNTTSKTVVFGLTSEDEMNIIFGYFY